MKYGSLEVGDVLICDNYHDKGCVSVVLGFSGLFKKTIVLMTFDPRNGRSEIHSWVEASRLNDWTNYGWKLA